MFSEVVRAYGGVLRPNGKRFLLNRNTALEPPCSGGIFVRPTQRSLSHIGNLPNELPHSLSTWFHLPLEARRRHPASHVQLRVDRRRLRVDRAQLLELSDKVVFVVALEFLRLDDRVVGLVTL